MLWGDIMLLAASVISSAAMLLLASTISTNFMIATFNIHNMINYYNTKLIMTSIETKSDPIVQIEIDAVGHSLLKTHTFRSLKNK